jgi:hypothetical protein
LQRLLEAFASPCFNSLYQIPKRYLPIVQRLRHELDAFRHAVGQPGIFEMPFYRFSRDAEPLRD